MESQENPGTEAEISAEAKTQTPTPDEKMKTLEAQIQSLQSELQTKDKSYKGLQRSLQEATEAARRQADLDAKLAQLAEQQELIALALANRETGDENTGTPQGYLADLKKLQAKHAEEARKREQERAYGEYDRIWKDVTSPEGLNLNKQDEDYWKIRSALKTGDKEEAEYLIEKLRNSRQSTPAKPSESPKETEADLKDRIRKELMQELGLLKTDNALPSGKAKTKDEIIARYAAGDPSISDKEYLEAGGL